jgi:EpsI family protein
MGSSKVALGLVLALSVMVGGAGYALRWRQPAPGAGTVQFHNLPLELNGYLGTEEWLDSATYRVLRADTTTMRRYVDPAGNPVWLFVAYFGAQNYGEQIHSPRNCLPGGGWNILSLDRVPMALPDRGDVTVNRLLIESDGARQVMLYFFITRLGCVASEYRLKFDLALAALSFKPRDAVFVRVSAPLREGGTEAAEARCRKLLSAAMPLLSQGLPF